MASWLLFYKGERMKIGLSKDNVRSRRATTWNVRQLLSSQINFSGKNYEDILP